MCSLLDVEESICRLLEYYEMKERNKRILENYLKYGKQYTSATSYNSRPQKICNYSRLRTTWPTRYDEIWNRYFAPLSAINLGIGGDKTEKRVMANR